MTASSARWKRDTIRRPAKTEIFSLAVSDVYKRQMIGGVLFAVTPTLTFYFSIGAALLPGPVFLLLLAKVPKRWGLTIIGVIISLLSLIMGMHWGMCVGGLIGAFLADMIAGTKNYRSKKLNILAYIVYSFGPMGTYIAYFVDPEGWASTMLQNGTTQE